MNDSNELKRRARRSFIFGGISAALGYTGWHWLHSSAPADGISWPLRRVLEGNGKLFQSLFDSERQPHAVKPPQAGKVPRFNGDLGLGPPIDPVRWRLHVSSDEDGDGEEDGRFFSFAELRLLPRTSTATDFKCIEGWTDRMSYAGFRFSDFLKATGLGRRLDGTLYPYVGLMTPDGGYYVSIDMPSMLHPQTVLAYEMNERPLLNQDGAPLRLIIPVKYGIKSLKRVGKIWFSDRRPPDYWAERGYDWYAGL
ncbi:MAG: molybdopterin-dependent oxidoreductase [Bdellovibrionia bacterium]